MTTAELIDKANLIYDSKLRTELEKTHLHSFIAIEPETGDYFFGETLSEAAASARVAHPNRRAAVLRVGHAAALHIGVQE